MILNYMARAFLLYLILVTEGTNVVSRRSDCHVKQESCGSRGKSCVPMETSEHDCLNLKANGRCKSPFYYLCSRTEHSHLDLQASRMRVHILHYQEATGWFIRRRWVMLHCRILRHHFDICLSHTFVCHGVDNLKHGCEQGSKAE